METIREKAAGEDHAMEQELTAMLEKLKEPEGAMGSLLGLELEACDPAEKTLTLSMEPAPWMANLMGWMHGGIISSAMDSTMGALCRWCRGGEVFTPTVTMQTTYLRPVMLSGRVYIRARVTHAGRSLISLTCELWAGSERERLLATACGTYATLRQDRKEGREET